jgi:5'-methylthioadenosine phosphorylase
MTTSPEAFLAREAEICYTTLSHVTDYDVWHTSEAAVTVDAVMQTFHQNLRLAQQAVANLIGDLDPEHDCACQHSLDHAIMTAPSEVSVDMLARLRPLLSRLYPGA